MIGPKVPDIIKLAARGLRKDMTESEQYFWGKIRYDILGNRFLRQKPIYLYTEDSGLDRFIIVDFFCEKKKLIIEIDGSIHDESEIFFLDREKEKYLKHAGYKILRFTNEEVLSNIDEVLLELKRELEEDI